MSLMTPVNATTIIQMMGKILNVLLVSSSSVPYTCKYFKIFDTISVGCSCSNAGRPLTLFPRLTCCFQKIFAMSVDVLHACKTLGNSYFEQKVHYYRVRRRFRCITTVGHRRHSQPGVSFAFLENDTCVDLVMWG